MKLETAFANGLLVLTPVVDRIDAAGAIEFKGHVRTLCEGYEGIVILNLEHVDFVDSSGIGAIVASMKLMAQGKRLDLAALRPAVAKVFALTKLDSIFKIHPDVASAAKLA